MREFADRITPPSWNIRIPGSGAYVKVPGTLNILLIPSDRPADDNPNTLGAVPSLMTFCNNVAETDLWLYPHVNKDSNWQATLIHELAHVAVNRWASFKARAHRVDGSVNFWLANEAPHGPLFQEALSLMLTRVMRELGSELKLGVCLELEQELIDYCRLYPPPRTNSHKR